VQYGEKKKVENHKTDDQKGLDTGLSEKKKQKIRAKSAAQVRYKPPPAEPDFYAHQDNDTK
jgi:hypothetical protein